MSKKKSVYRCNDCGGTSAKWLGQCPSCKAWNSLQESIEAESGANSSRYASWTGINVPVQSLKSVKGQDFARESSGLSEFDRVLGGGIVPGSVTLLGGDPGIGKSTLLLQVMAHLSKKFTVLYVTGEESQQQVALRAERLTLQEADIFLAAETELEKILQHMEAIKPSLVVIDSIQTIYSPVLQSAPGSVVQVRECAAHLTRAAKSSDTSIVLVGHVTKEGTLAGPRVLEHMVDTVLYFEGDADSSFRMVRAWKNRFGPANELGVFSMGPLGLEEVSNPSSMFLVAHESAVSGSCITSAVEGNRPFLVEVQALVEDAATANPKRYSSGFETSRLQMLLAVLAKHNSTEAHDQNVYVKVVGGVRLTEPAADLSVLLSCYSSLRNKPLPTGLVVFGEVGLAGELRAVSDAVARLKEAAKLGYTTAIIPAQCKVTQAIPGLTVKTASRVDQVLDILKEI